MKPNHKNPLLAAVITLTLAAPSASAVEYYWDSNDATVNFGSLNASSTWAAPTAGTPTNGWSTSNTGAIVVDGNSITTTTSDALNFGRDATNTGLGGTTLTVSGTVDALFLRFGSQTTGNKTLTGGTINFAAAGSIHVGAGGTVVHTIASAITGAATSLTKTGNALALSGANSYSGGTIISAGSLIFRNTGAKPGSGTHAFAAGSTLGLGVATSGSFFSSSDIDNAFAGTMTGSLSNVTVDATTNVGIDTTAGAFTYATSVAGSPTRGLLKFGANALTLTGANTYTGSTVINAGTLRLENTAAVSGSSEVRVLGTLQLGTDTTFTSFPNLLLTGGTISSDKATPSSLGITHVLGNAATSNATQNFTAGTNVFGGNAAIQLGNITNSSGGGGTATFNPTTANLIITGGYTSLVNTGTNNLALGGTSQGNSIGGVIENGTRTTQNLTKSGTSSWTLSGANTHNGATSVTAGTLTLANSLALQNSSLDTTASVLGTAAAGFNTTVTTLTIGGLTGINDLASRFITGGYSGVTALTLNPGTGITHSYAGIIADGAVGMTLTKTGAGTQVLSGLNAYTGGTTVTAGILQPTLATALAFYTTPGEVVFNGGAIVTVMGDGSSTGWSTTQVDLLLNNATKTSGALGIDTTVASVSFAPTNLTGGIGLTKLGANTLTLTSANTHTGNTTITTTTGGTLRLENTGAVQNSAVVSINNRTLEVATDTAFSSSTPLSIAGGTIVSDRASSGAGLTHAFGNLAASHATHNFTAGAFATGTTAAIQVASLTCASGSGGTATFNPTTANLIIAGNATGANTGTSTFKLDGTSQGNSIGGAIENGTRTTQNVTKSNTSTWTLNGVNTYSGNTNVTAGTLVLSNAASASNANTGNDASTVTIAPTGAFLNLTYTGTDKVAKLVINAIEQPAGVYGHTNSGANNGGQGVGFWDAYFGTGTGTITVVPGYSAWAALNGAGPNLNDDHDNDGVDNGTEYFIGGPTGNTTGFTPLPGVTNTGGVLSVTWTKAANYTGTYGTDFSVETSATLTGVWATEPSPGTVAISGTNVTYTFPPGTINFARLKVTGP